MDAATLFRSSTRRIFTKLLAVSESLIKTGYFVRLGTLDTFRIYL